MMEKNVSAIWKTELWKSPNQIPERKRIKNNKDSLSNLWGNIKCTNIHIIGVPEG